MPMKSEYLRIKEKKMRRRLFAAVLCSLLFLVCVASVASAESLFPQVTLNFEPSTWTYTYHVVVPGSSPYAFGELDIFSKAICWDAVNSVDTWTFKGPVVNGVDLGWSAYSIDGSYEDPTTHDWITCDTIVWRTGSIDQEVLSGPWEGDFVIVAENTAPVDGQGFTKDGDPASDNYFKLQVPGTFVPEPSSIVALGSMAAMAAGLFIKRKR